MPRPPFVGHAWCIFWPFGQASLCDVRRALVFAREYMNGNGTARLHHRGLTIRPMGGLERPHATTEER
jgi:hypothetical protein